MERFPRGTLPPKAFAAVVNQRKGIDPARDLDFSTTCPNCSAQMLPEHAHYRCPACGYRDSSSF
ncbi:MAG: hypothetical protein JO257_08725 [Deltaproteobacteria bacterium]|nr:hypothetical protein [Deltaproteobacteria bacterium]